MRIIALSDTHGNLPEPSKIPRCDIIIHAGDLCPNFAYDSVYDAERQYKWLKTSFLPWQESLKYKHFLFVPGNHDTAFDLHCYRYQSKNLLENNGVSVLIDDSVTIDGIKFYGTPWIVPVANWSFMARDKTRKLMRDIIPDDTQILISHSPPYGILDEQEHFGCQFLSKRIEELSQLQYLICGHCHGDGGKSIKYNNVTIMNAADNIMEINI